MPRGRPSSVSQISTTAAAVCSSKIPKPGRTVPARSTNSVTASDVTPPSSASGDTDTTASPATSSRSRDVAMIRGVRSGRGSARWPRRPPARTCSQLSITMSRRRPATASATVSMTAVSPCGVMPRALAMASGTASGSPTGASSTSHTPSGNSSASSAADGEGQPGLADPADAAQRHQLVGADQRRDLGQHVGRARSRVVADLGRLPRRTSRLTPVSLAPSAP